MLSTNLLLRLVNEFGGAAVGLCRVTAACNRVGFTESSKCFWIETWFLDGERQTVMQQYLMEKNVDCFGSRESKCSESLLDGRLEFRFETDM